MGISFSSIRPALDTALCTVSGITATGAIGTRNFIPENSTFDFSTIADWGSKVFVRSTLVHNRATVETLGLGATVRYSGVFVVDIFGRLDKGYTTVTTLFDAVIAKFTPGTFVTLTSGGPLTILGCSPSPLPQGAYNVGGLYVQQLVVDWELYAVP